MGVVDAAFTSTSWEVSVVRIARSRLRVVCATGEVIATFSHQLIEQRGFAHVGAPHQATNPERSPPGGAQIESRFQPSLQSALPCPPSWGLLSAVCSMAAMSPLRSASRNSWFAAGPAAGWIADPAPPAASGLHVQHMAATAVVISQEMEAVARDVEAGALGSKSPPRCRGCCCGAPSFDPGGFQQAHALGHLRRCASAPRQTGL